MQLKFYSIQIEFRIDENGKDIRAMVSLQEFIGPKVRSLSVGGSQQPIYLDGLPLPGSLIFHFETNSNKILNEF